MTIIMAEIPSVPTITPVMMPTPVLLKIYELPPLVVVKSVLIGIMPMAHILATPSLMVLVLATIYMVIPMLGMSPLTLFPLSIPVAYCFMSKLKWLQRYSL
jgi:hypothetical protein